MMPVDRQTDRQAGNGSHIVIEREIGIEENRGRYREVGSLTWHCMCRMCRMAFSTHTHSHTHTHLHTRRFSIALQILLPKFVSSFAYSIKMYTYMYVHTYI